MSGILRLVMLGLCAAGCDGLAGPIEPPAERGEAIPPAAHGAIGAYARSGETPWTRTGGAVARPEPPGGPSPPDPKRAPRAIDGGVAL